MQPLLLLPPNLDKPFVFFPLYYLFISFSTPFFGGLFSTDLSPLVSLPFVFLHARLFCGVTLRVTSCICVTAEFPRGLFGRRLPAYLFLTAFSGVFSLWFAPLPAGVFQLFPSFSFFFPFLFSSYSCARSDGTFVYSASRKRSHT